MYDVSIDFLSLADSGLTHQAIQGGCLKSSLQTLTVILLLIPGVESAIIKLQC